MDLDIFDWFILENLNGSVYAVLAMQAYYKKTVTGIAALEVVLHWE